MHLLYIFITFFINIYALPVPYNDSVYVHINSFIDKKCPYLKDTKLFDPQPEFLSSCTNFTAVKSITKLSRDNINQAVCLLYYNSFRQLCTQTTSKTIVPNDIIDIAVRTYQTDTKKVCSIITNNQYIAEEIKPGIDTVYNYLHRGDCSRICTDFDLNLNPACILTAVAIGSLETQLPNDGIHKSKPYITTHNGDHSSMHQGSLINDNNSNIGDINNNNNNKLLNAKPENKPNSAIMNDNSLLKTLENAANAQNDLVKPTALEQASSTTIIPLNPVNDIVKPDVKQATSERTQSGNTDLENPPQTNPLDVLPNNVKNDVHLPGIEQESSQIKNNAGEIITNDNPSSKLAPVDPEVQDAPNVNNSPTTAGVKSTVGDKSSATPDVTKNQNKPEKSNNDVKPNVDTNLNNPESISPPILEAPIEASNDKKDESNIPNINGNGDKNQDNMDADQDEDPVMFDNKENAEQPDGPEYDDPEIKLPEAEVKLSPTGKGKPSETIEENPNLPANYENQNIDDSDSYFFSYFMMVCIMFICAYVAYHNKQKILALVVEGRKGRRPSRTRRPNSANYRKLDSNLEEAVTSSCNKNATHVIY